MEQNQFITFDQFAKLDLRIATIIEAEPHPNADRLLKLQIDIGNERRQICAGIKTYYKVTDLIGKQVVVVTNLEPRKIRGEISNGMLVAATVQDNQQEQISEVVLIGPTKPVPAGSKAS